MVSFLSLCHDFSTLGWTHLSSTSDSCIKQLLESPLLCLIDISNQLVPNLTPNLYAKICSTQSQLMATPIFTIAQTKLLEASLTLLCRSYPTSNPSENSLPLTSKYVYVSANLTESSFWLFSAPSIIQILWYMLIHDANILTFCSLFHPHASCPDLFVPNLLIWFLPEQDQSTKPFCYCPSVHMYPYLM